MYQQDRDDTFKMVIASEDTEMEMRQIHILILKQVTRNSEYTTDGQSEHMIQILEDMLRYCSSIEFTMFYQYMCYDSIDQTHHLLLL
ncbi:hypothetical protein EPI10_008375 [Gossypium australe]|uniref:Uncharacterized protein n=1 Tax=Gossypium australe TaxID=47621 RepID=A0A5B6V4E1_9ROSI|nr:hypothetical protein EPI10_008375 [Gossypium australe]